jgi:pimeloyl-ACP methyl ester carboxylesterase
MASLLAAPEIKNLQAMALKSPVSNYPGSLFSRMKTSELHDWKRKGYHTFINAEGLEQRINYSFFQDAMAVNVFQILDRIRIPVLIVHGSRDEIVPVAQSRKTAFLLPDCRLEVIKGADHTYSQTLHFNQMIKFISRFIIEFNPHN